MRACAWVPFARAERNGRDEGGRRVSLRLGARAPLVGRGRGRAALQRQHGTSRRGQIAAGTMPDGPADHSATTCFGTVSKRIGRLFRRLPKSRSWSEGLRLIRTPSTSCSLTFSGRRYYSPLTCSDCSYPCHLEYQDIVQLYRNQNDRETDDALAPGTHLTHNQQREDGPYTDIIDVHLKLRKPVSVVTESRTPGAVSDLPPDEVKRVHVSSSTTVGEVIQGLLGKFSSQNDPCRFTLYHQMRRDGQDVLQKLSQSEHPLCLQRKAEPDMDAEAKPLMFVLRENERADVEWYAFSVPELQNFLTILRKEEEMRVGQVERRYRQYREKLTQVLQEAQGKPG